MLSTDEIFTQIAQCEFKPIVPQDECLAMLKANSVTEASLFEAILTIQDVYTNELNLTLGAAKDELILYMLYRMNKMVKIRVFQDEVSHAITTEGDYDAVIDFGFDSNFVFDSKGSLIRCALDTQ